MASIRSKNSNWKFFFIAALCTMCITFALLCLDDQKKRSDSFQQTTLQQLPASLSATTLNNYQPFFRFALPAGAALTLCLALFSCWLLKRNRQWRLECQQYQEENVRLNKAAETSEQRYSHLFNNAGDAIFLIDPHLGTLHEINQRGQELLGYTKKELQSLRLSDMFPGTHWNRYLRLVKKVQKNGYGEESNLLFRRKDGSLFTGAVHAKLGELGETKLVHGVLRDITHFRQLEKMLRKKNRDLALVNKIAHRAAGSRDLKKMASVILEEVIRTFEVDGGGVYQIRHEGNELQLLTHLGIEKEVLEDLHRLSPGKGLAGRVAATGKPSSSSALQNDPRLWSKAVQKAGWQGFYAVPLSSNEKTVGVLFIFSRAGRTFTSEETNLLVAIGKQIGTAFEGTELFEALRWQCRLTEASHRELERSRQQLRENLAKTEEANHALERLDHMKNNFLAIASHELRTPLTYILSGTELLIDHLQEHLVEKEKELLRAVRKGGMRLQEIVDDLMEVAQIESQELSLDRKSVQLPLVIQQLVEEFKPLSKKRDISLFFTKTPSELTIKGDHLQLTKTFQRLLENAVKFTPEKGQVEIEVQLKKQEELRQRESVLRTFSPSFFNSAMPGQFAQVTVRDSGIGIDPEDHLRIFEKFYETGDSSRHFTSRTRFGGKGVGLGLTLVKGVVEAHGGMTWVESQGGQGDGGSAFHVLLPLS